MFGQIVEKLDTYLGRQFLMGCYLPCLIVTVVNLFLAYAQFPAFRTVLATEYTGVTTSKAVDFVIFLIGVGFFAYAISPLTPFLKVLLQGDRLWRWVAEPLLLLYALKRDEQQAHLAALEDRRNLLPPDTDEIRKRLLRDREAGIRLKQAGDPDSIKAAGAAIKEIGIRRMFSRLIDPGLFTAAVTALGLALQRNCAELESLKVPVSAASRINAERLQALYMEMYDTLIPYVMDIAKQTETNQLEEQSKNFADAELAPTRLGNDAAELRGYCFSCYGFDFDFFWPRLLLIIQKDKTLGDTMVAAKAQVDFWVLALALTVLTTAGWMLVLIIGGDRSSLTTLLILAIAAPPILLVMLRLVHASYALFSELVRGIIDTRRLDLIEALHFARPANAEAEKQIWADLTRWLKLHADPPDREYIGSKPAPSS